MGGIGMMRAIRAPAPGSPSRPQVLTAMAGGLAEASFLVLPVYQALTGAILGRAPMPLFVGVFLVGYAGGVGLACRYRTAQHVSAMVAAVAIGVGVMIGGGAAVQSVYTVIVFLLLGARLLMLGFRDWDEPSSVGFLVGTLVIGVEALVGSPPPWSWGLPLLLLVPIFSRRRSPGAPSTCGRRPTPTICPPPLAIARSAWRCRRLHGSPSRWSPA